MDNGGEVLAEYSMERFPDVDPVSGQTPLEYTAFYDGAYVHGEQVQIDGDRQVSLLSTDLELLF